MLNGWQLGDCMQRSPLSHTHLDMTDCLFQTMANYHDIALPSSVPLNDTVETKKWLQGSSSPSAINTLLKRYSVDSYEVPTDRNPDSLGFSISMSSLDAILGEESSSSRLLRSYLSSLSSIPDFSRSYPNPASFDLSQILNSLGSLPPTVDIDPGPGPSSWYYNPPSLINFNPEPPLPFLTTSLTEVTPPISPVVLKSAKIPTHDCIDIADDAPAVIFRSASASVSGPSLSLANSEETADERVSSSASKKNAALPTVVIDENNNVSELLPTDIVSGRGSGVYEHSGNVLMRDIVSSYADYYKSIPEAHRKEKTKVAKQIVLDLQQEHGARFLKRQGDAWVIASDKLAQEKISRSLREDYGNSEKYKDKREKYKKQ